MTSKQHKIKPQGSTESSAPIQQPVGESSTPIQQPVGESSTPIQQSAGESSSEASFVEHKRWALDRCSSQEHVSFPTFVIRFGFYDRAGAHCAFNNLLNYGRINQQRLKRITQAYGYFKANNEDLFWSKRLEKKSSDITVRDASVKVQESGLKQVELNLFRQLKRNFKEVGVTKDDMMPVAPSTSKGSMLTRKKHSRDQSDDDDSALQCTSQNPKQSRRVSFGRSLTLEDLRTPEYPSPKDGDVYDKPMPENLQSSVGSSLPSTDPDDASYYTDQDLRESTSKILTWNYLVGNGRVDSRVDNAWVIDNVEVGRGLMNFRDGVVRENGVMTKPYEKLVINFIFLVEAEYQTGGLQGKVEDQIWESLCNTVKDTVSPLSDSIVTEAHRWARQLAQNNSEAFLRLLDDSPPQDRTLKTILTKMADTAQLWNTQTRNEDTYLKSLLGPFLDTYFGKVKYTKSDWTPVQDDTRSSELDLLIPDYATTTQVGEQQLYVVLLEGKVAKNKGLDQIWDDQTKLGQEMKAALDSILKLEPDGEVCVIGLLIREPSIEFYTMQVHAEATYIMHKFAASYIPPDAMNVFNLAHLMEVFAHARVKVEKTVTQIRRVKVNASPNSKVPLSWLRPSFKKPKLCQVPDGQ